MLPNRRLLHDRYGGPARAIFNLAAPLTSQEATDMRTVDMSDLTQLDLFASQAQVPSASGAVSPLIGPLGQVPGTGLRQGDVERAFDRSTPTIRATPGTSGSTSATRTTGTRTTRIARAWSADRDGAGFFSCRRVLRAWLTCRRSKRSTGSARAFEAHLLDNLAELSAELEAGTWRPGRSIMFAIARPKPREVWAAPIRDRVVHHLLYQWISTRFERAFITDSCACIPGRGTLYAARRLEAKVRSITQNHTRPAYYLKCDVANFFVSIDKAILQPLLEERIPEPELLELALRILHHDPRDDVEIQGSPASLARVPAHKSLLHQPAGRGLPIGNLSSQFFANVYLDRLDQFAKHHLRARHYVRYVDDFVLLDESPRQLHAWRAAIEAFLPDRLALRLNPAKTVIQPLSRGVDFVGQVINPHHSILRRRTLHAALARLAKIPAEDIPAAACSYLGLARQPSHGHTDQARIANAARKRGFAVDHQFTKVYP